MSVQLVTENIWPSLTKTVKAACRPCHVAVAYFGVGASRQLPLPKGSRLVVDASERAVKSGQTCPDELRKLASRGVKVFSVPNLHAKVYVVGKRAIVGSANVSRHSKGQLIEAVLATTDSDAVAEARQFVGDLCLHKLDVRYLQKLQRSYHPPHIPGGKKEASRQQRNVLPTLPRLCLAQLVYVDWSERENRLHDSALKKARKQRKHRRSHRLESFLWTGQCGFRTGDLVIQVMDEGHGKYVVHPPANVVYTRRYETKKGTSTFVFLEAPSALRCRNLRILAHQLGRGAHRTLRRRGQVRNREFAQRLLGIWHA